MYVKQFITFYIIRRSAYAWVLAFGTWKSWDWHTSKQLWVTEEQNCYMLYNNTIAISDKWGIIFSHYHLLNSLAHILSKSTFCNLRIFDFRFLDCICISVVNGLLQNSKQWGKTAGYAFDTKSVMSFTPFFASLIAINMIIGAIWRIFFWMTWKS